MRGENLLKSINELDSKLIEEAVEPIAAETKRWSGGWYLSGAAAACLIIGAIVGATLFRMDRRGAVSPSQESEEMVTETVQMQEIETDTSEILTKTIVPILGNERLVIWTEDKTIRIVNQFGQTEDVIRDALLLDETECFGGKIVQQDETLPIVYQKDGEDCYGMWSVRDGKWLYDKEEAEESELIDERRFITMPEWSTEYLYDGEYIYDGAGKVIHKTNGQTVLAIQGNKVLYQLDDGYSLQYVTGAEIWKQEDSLMLDDISDSYINWHDREGNGVVTDLFLNVLATDESFYQDNPQIARNGRGIFVQSRSEGFAANNMEYLIGMYTDEERVNPDDSVGREINYYLCDSEFKVIKQEALREYPSGMLVFEHTSDRKRIPWNLVNLEINDLRLTPFWNGETLRIEFPFTETDYLIIESSEGNGSPLCIHGSWGDSRCSVFVLNGKQQEIVQNGSFSLDVSDEQIIKLSTINEESTQPDVKIFCVSKDGTWISVNEGDELYYWVNYIFCVGQDAEGVFIELRDGNQKIRLE